MARPRMSALLQIQEGNPNNRTKKELVKKAKIEQALNNNLNEKLFLAPDEMSDDGKIIFRKLKKLLINMKILTDNDIFIVTNLSELIAMTNNLHSQIEVDGYVDENGRPNPLIKEWRSNLTLQKQFLNELGLTPNARNTLAASLDNDKQEEKDEFDNVSVN